MCNTIKTIENVSQTSNIEKIEITPDIMSGSEHDKSIQNIENDEIFSKEESDMLDTKLGDLINVENERKRSLDIDSASNTQQVKKKCSEWKGVNRSTAPKKDTPICLCLI